MSTPPVALASETALPRSWTVRGVLRHNVSATVGAVVLLLIVLAAVAAPALAPTPLYERVGDGVAPPSGAHPLGLDAEAATIQIPVLVLRGAASDVLSKDGATEVASILPNARVETIASAGHLAAGDNPASTANLIRDFLDEVLPTSK